MEPLSLLTSPVTTQDHLWGDRRAPVTLVEYGDYECQHTARAQPVLLKLVSDFNGRLRLAYRHFPLRTLHPRAWEAAQAAEAAAVQGRFWEMHGILIARRGRLEREQLLDRVAELGMGVGRFERDLISQDTIDRIHEDRMSGVLSGVEQTPTFYINGAQLQEQWSYETLADAVRRALQASGRGAA
jgi:protein-disulfide isomerase